MASHHHRRLPPLLGKFLKARKVLAVGDETSLIMKTPASAAPGSCTRSETSPRSWQVHLDGTVVGEGRSTSSRNTGSSTGASSATAPTSATRTLAEWEKGYDHAPARVPKLKEYATSPS